MFPDHRGNAFFGNLSNMHRELSFRCGVAPFARPGAQPQSDAGRNPECMLQGSFRATYPGYPGLSRWQVAVIFRPMPRGLSQEGCNWRVGRFWWSTSTVNPEPPTARCHQAGPARARVIRCRLERSGWTLRPEGRLPAVMGRMGNKPITLHTWTNAKRPGLRSFYHLELRRSSRGARSRLVYGQAFDPGRQRTDALNDLADPLAVNPVIHRSPRPSFPSHHGGPTPSQGPCSRLNPQSRTEAMRSDRSPRLDLPPQCHRCSLVP